MCSVLALLLSNVPQSVEGTRLWYCEKNVNGRNGNGKTNKRPQSFVFLCGFAICPSLSQQRASSQLLQHEDEWIYNFRTTNCGKNSFGLFFRVSNVGSRHFFSWNTTSDSALSIQEDRKRCFIIFPCHGISKITYWSWTWQRNKLIAWKSGTREF